MAPAITAPNRAQSYGEPWKTVSDTLLRMLPQSGRELGHLYTSRSLGGGQLPRGVNSWHFWHFLAGEPGAFHILEKSLRHRHTDTGSLRLAGVPQTGRSEGCIWGNDQCPCSSHTHGLRQAIPVESVRKPLRKDFLPFRVFLFFVCHHQASPHQNCSPFPSLPLG